jgi:hypothetical protein
MMKGEEGGLARNSSGSSSTGSLGNNGSSAGTSADGFRNYFLSALKQPQSYDYKINAYVHSPFHLSQNYESVNLNYQIGNKLGTADWLSTSYGNKTNVSFKDNNNTIFADYSTQIPNIAGLNYIAWYAKAMWGGRDNYSIFNRGMRSKDVDSPATKTSFSYDRRYVLSEASKDYNINFPQFNTSWQKIGDTITGESINSVIFKGTESGATTVQTDAGISSAIARTGQPSLVILARPSLN